MTGRRQQPSRAAKTKAAFTVQGSGVAGSTLRVTKRTAPKKATVKKSGPQSKKPKTASKKRKAPTSSSRGRRTATQNQVDDAESDVGAAYQSRQASQAAVSGEDRDGVRSADFEQEGRPLTNVEGNDADNVGNAEITNGPDEDVGGGTPADFEPEDRPQADAEKNGSDNTSNDEPIDRPDDDPAEDLRVEPLTALATSDVRGPCIFRDHEAELAVALKVFNHPDNVSRVGYYAKFRLTVADPDAAGETIDGSTIGHILAWRISKPTASLLHVNDAWLDEILAAEDVDVDMEETALCLSGLFDRDGTPKPIVGANTNQLDQNPLMFIEMIYVHDDFQGNGLLQPTLELFYAAVAQLPEWFAFAGTVVLIPAPPGDYRGRAWRKQKTATVEDKLTQIYQRHSYVLWLRNAMSRDSFVNVMGRTLP